MNKKPKIGFISAPAWFDPAPSEFPTVVEECVLTQQAPLLLPEFDYRLETIATTQNELNLCARSLKAMGCDLIAQVGSPFAWACAQSEAEARYRKEAITSATELPALMTSLAMVDALRELGVNKIAVNCTYYDNVWRDGFSYFMNLCGFDVVHVSSLSDQGVAGPEIKIEDFGWSMTNELTSNSIAFSAGAASSAEAIVVTGTGARTLDIISELETKIQRPIVAADTALYWAAARELGLTLKPSIGILSNI